MVNVDEKHKDMWTSASAITDASDCFRRWWFNKVIKMPQDQRKATILGDVFHAVLERYFRADDRGLDDRGNLIELYPAGWKTMKSRFGKDDTLYTITDTEAALVKILITEAITQGILVREPGRIIERSIDIPILSQGRTKAILKGFIDIDSPRSITDHKTAKNTNYILSKAKIKKSIQMMIYGYAKYVEGHRNNLWLTHNNFIKDFDNPQVIQRSVEVTAMEIVEFFQETIEPILKRMLNYYIKYPKTSIHKWRDIPGANNPNQACNHHYGKPCPYIGVCTATCSIDNYLRKYGLTVNELVGYTDETEKGPKKMGLMEKIREEKAKKAAAAAAAGISQPAQPEPAQAATAVVETAEPVVKSGGMKELLARMVGKKTAAEPEQAAAPVVEPAAAVVPEPAQPDLSGKQVAPWYTDYNGQLCVACSDNAVPGYNSEMEPCRICDIRAKEAGKPTSEDYKVDVNTDGSLTFTYTGVAKSAPAGDTTVKVVAEKPVVKVDMQPVKDAAELKAVKDAAEQFKESAALPTAKKVEAMMKGPQSFTMLIGCTFANDHTDLVIYADSLLASVLNDVATAAGKEIACVEHFALMQAIDAMIPSLLPDLKGFTVISLPPSKGSAHARLIDGLRLHATTIIFPFAV